MEVVAPLGIVVATCAQDHVFCAGLCSSIRHFMGDIPICLIVDGDLCVKRLASAYNLLVMHREDVQSRPLRDASFGWGVTSMVAQWEGPFERYIQLDADMIVWGDLLEAFSLRTEDEFVCTNYSEPMHTSGLVLQFYNPDILRHYTEVFDWSGQCFFNSGCYAIRRNLLDLDEYLDVLKIRSANREAFFPGEQGLLNFMLHRKVSKGLITSRCIDLQAYVGMYTRVELARQFPFKDGEPCVIGNPRVIHWLGENKPYLKRMDKYPDPMTYFRRKAMERMKHPMRHLGRLWMRYEDFKSENTRFRRTPYRWLKRSIERLLDADVVDRAAGKLIHW